MKIGGTDISNIKIGSTSINRVIKDGVIYWEVTTTTISPTTTIAPTTTADSYWTPQAPLGGETPNLWVKEGTRDGLILPDTVNPGAGDASILMPCFKTVDRTERISFASEKNAGTVYTIYFRGRLDEVGDNAVQYYTSAQNGVFFNGITKTWQHRPQNTACVGTANCLEASLWTDNLFHDFCLIRNGTSVEFYVDNVKKGDTITMAANPDYLFTFMMYARNIAFISEYKIFKSIKTPTLAKTDIPDFIWLIFTGYNCTEVINGESLVLSSYGDHDNTYYSSEGSQYALNYGYDRYTKIATYDYKKDINVLHKIDGTKSTAGTLGASPYRYEIAESHAGSLINHNFADSYVYISGANWDRSDATIWSDNARVAIDYTYGFYDVNNPNLWHTSELSQENLDYLLNDDYKDQSFIKASINSINAREYLKEIFAYTNPVTGVNLKKVLIYTNDYEQWFNYFTKEGANSMLTGGLIYPAAQYFNGKTYITYQGNSVDPYITVYNHSTKLWTTPVRIGISDDPDTDIGHVYPAILITPDGYIHIFYGCHSTPMKYSKSTNPEDISAWTEQTDPVNDEASYPQLLQFSDGTIYLFYRSRTVATGCKWGYKTSTDGGANWSAYVDLFQEFAYWTFKKGIGDTIHAAAAGYMTTSLTHLNLYYAQYSGGQWKKIDGTVLTPPVFLTATDIKIYDTGAKSIPIPNTHFDSSNVPYIAFAEGVDTGGIGDYENKIIKYNGTTWDVVSLGCITKTHTNGVPTLIVGSNGYIEMYVISEGKISYVGGNLEKWVSNDYGDTWRKDSVVVYGNVIFPSVVVNFHPDAKIAVGQWIADPTVWNSKGYLLGDKGFIKNYKGENW